LTAFYQGADALEHWQTLTPSRVPATLAAPFQVQLDPAALAEHPDRDAFVAFGRQHFQDEWLADLEAAQGGIDIEEMSHVLTHASRAAQAVPSEQHALRDRLARTVYWLMAKHGFEEELGLYTAVFDPPPDDPSLHRLRALMHEQAGDKAEAQRAWATYAAELDQLPMIRAEDRALAGGLIWFHMGNVAERAAPRPPMGGFPFLADVDDEAPAFDGLHCYQQSAQMAPTLLIAHEAAIDRLQAAGRQREKVQAARHLLRHFPEHEQALVVLADDAFRRDRWDQAVAFQTRAVQARPHVEELRATLGFYELGLARLRAQQGKFDAARAILSTQLDQAKPAEKARLLCRQAAVELKAGEHALGESLYDQARTVALSPLTAALDMLIEAVRMPVEAQWIRTVEQAFRQELKGEWHSLSACYLLDVVSAFASLNIDYEAYEQHQKWVFQYLRRGLKLPLSEAELCHICNGLKYFASQKLLLDYARRGQKEYPEHPLFPLSQAVHYVMRDPEKCPWDKADDLLHTAHDLAAADPAHAELLEPIDALLSRVHSAMERQRFNALTSLQGRALDDLDELSPFEALNALQRLFGDLLDDDDDDDDDIVDFFNPFGPPPGRRRSRSPSRRKKSSRRKR
jgi:tetratricopeptide (TPR) repeat protein